MMEPQRVALIRELDSVGMDVKAVGDLLDNWQDDDLPDLGRLVDQAFIRLERARATLARKPNNLGATVTPQVSAPWSQHGEGQS